MLSVFVLVLWTFPMLAHAILRCGFQEEEAFPVHALGNLVVEMVEHVTIATLAQFFRAVPPIAKLDVISQK